MPRPDDHSDGASTLPTPELNPLLNPVLGQNMGRWAEVYFTSPPEKREEAVLELLRKLRAENPELEAAGIGPDAVSAPGEPRLAEAYPQIVEAEQASVRCDACGRENPASHKFCGMCGIPIAEPVAIHAAATEHGMADLRVSDLHFSDLNVSDPRLSDPHVSDLQISDLQLEDFPGEPAAAYEPRLNVDELRSFRNTGEKEYGDDSRGGMFESESPSRPYRIYVGIALAVVIFALAYLAWRSTQAASQSAAVVSPPPPSIATPPAASAPAPTPSTSTNDTAAPTSASSAPVATATPEPANARSRTRRASGKPVQAEPRAASAAETSTVETSGGNGAEELAMAQRYLDGTDGQERNRAEAAKWLWKSMGKHNARATLLLADLYLKGDGVAKNCDQARVLLDSATRAGVKEAAERLRHVQAFGCQ